MKTRDLVLEGKLPHHVGEAMSEHWRHNVIAREDIEISISDTTDCCKYAVKKLSQRISTRTRNMHDTKHDTRNSNSLPLEFRRITELYSIE